MFGYVRPYMPDLSAEEKARWRGFYCGLCRKLQEKYGLAGRMGLNNDMTFLTLLLGSLYEPDEAVREAVCPPHPLKKHPEIVTSFTDYAAGMTIALAYHKALDDWEDEGRQTGKLFSGMLSKHYQAVREQWPAPCEGIETAIAAIHETERSDSAQPESAADWSGRMLAGVFAVKQGFFQRDMARLGYCLGKFIYMVDAAVDYERDKKKGCFNPLPGMNVTPEEAGELLRQPLGQAAEIFEGLPLLRDAHILRNTLYSGVWQQYNRQMKKRAGDEDGH